MVYDVIIVGAGIVGLATGVKLLEKKPSLKIIYLEKEDEIAKHQTGNNSGVIHSGVYYKPGSLKAENCTRGYNMLLEFCRKNEVNFDICGKIILAASNKEIPLMNNIYERGIKNGLKGLQILKPEEIKEIEPYAAGVAAIKVPQTGIIDYKEVSCKYLEISQNYNAEISFNQKLENILIKNNLCEVITNSRTFVGKSVVTCTGLFSDRVAKLTHPELDFRLIPFRGEYYKLKKGAKQLVRNLIYPVPDPSFPFLGVHFTRMIDNEVECGPNAVLSFKREGYNKTSFNMRDTFETFSWAGFHKIIAKNWKTGLGEFYRSYSKAAFVKALQKLVPDIKAEDLDDGGSGVRAQACMKDGRLLDDFYIIENEKIVHVCNAPSPAATASLSIGNYAAEKVIAKLC
ncbi:MAG: fad dependent oxidoreductase [Ignavibacteria bacterium]|nr:MAG: fad dependent oxidoreductase [Ignavibacteria bacterium]KAF0161222.1 MAG: fad dependent oxidoreductase [Ignavibacteria bacterium]